MEDTVDSPDRYGCLPALVATAFAALLVLLGLFPPTSYALPLYLPVFIVTAIIVACLGLPLFLFAQHFDRANAWTAAVAGLVTGAALPASIAFSNSTLQQWIGVTAYGIAGASGGLMFFLVGTAQRTPRRNVAAMMALATISIAAMLTIQPWVA